MGRFFASPGIIIISGMAAAVAVVHYKFHNVTNRLKQAEKLNAFTEEDGGRDG